MMMTLPQLAKELNRHRTTLIRWSKKPGFPAGQQINSRSCIYDLAEVKAWVNAKEGAQ